MTSETKNLTKALKGDSKVQGDWGEIILERILEESGLSKEDYVLQGTGMGLTHPETGKPSKPDVLVKLPEGKHIIIDAKVSLTHYERFGSEEREEEREKHLNQFLISVKQHVRDLEERRYSDIETLNTPDFVLMFMPIEGAFLLAMQHDRELHHYAWGKKVVIVCPSTLFATLRTIASMWRIELQHRNVQKIAEQGGNLYDKVYAFVEDMQSLGRQLDKSKDTYDGAMKKLSTGTGNIVKRTQDLQKLGAKTSKDLRKALPQAFEVIGEE